MMRNIPDFNIEDFKNQIDSVIGNMITDAFLGTNDNPLTKAQTTACKDPSWNTLTTESLSKTINSLEPVKPPYTDALVYEKNKKLFKALPSIKVLTRKAPTNWLKPGNKYKNVRINANFKFKTKPYVSYSYLDSGKTFMAPRNVAMKELHGSENPENEVYLFNKNESHFKWNMGVDLASTDKRDSTVFSWMYPGICDACKLPERVVIERKLPEIKDPIELARYRQLSKMNKRHYVCKSIYLHGVLSAL